MKKWADSEVDTLRKSYGSVPSREIAKMLGRSYASIRRKAFYLGLRLDESQLREALAAPKIDADQTGERNPNWRGGRSQNAYYYKKVQKHRYPQHVAAREMVQKAIKAGRLVRCPCEICGASGVEAHHDDYGKPLDVRWLCPTHHRALHAQNSRPIH